MEVLLTLSQIYAILEDKDGINISGTGIGHDLICWLDEDRSKYFILNSFFENDNETYGKGTVNYMFSKLDKGKHTITLRAWDNFNNSSQKTLTFHVEDDNKFILNNLLNFPNPFFSDTRITVCHNRPTQKLR
jgi:hypothetical protein